MNWIISRLKWVFIAAAVIGPFLAYMSWEDNRHITNVKENGVETVAVIEGATLTTKRRRSDSYTIDLGWKDEGGEIRRAKEVSISSGYAKTIISDDKLIASTVPIKYLSDKPGVKPIVLPDVANQEDTNDFMIQAGGIGGGVGILGALGWFFLGGRRGN